VYSRAAEAHRVEEQKERKEIKEKVEDQPITASILSNSQNSSPRWSFVDSPLKAPLSNPQSNPPSQKPSDSIHPHPTPTNEQQHAL
jgi:hypothetical protein